MWGWLRLSLAHACHLLCDAVGFLLVLVSRLIDRELGLYHCGYGGMYGNAAEVPVKDRVCG